MSVQISITDRFLRFVEKGENCWRWTGSKRFTGGYGAFWRNGRTDHAHRVSWALFRGDVPEGLWVLHRCDNPECVNPECVNPDHLFLGTPRDNTLDKIAKGRANWATGEKHGSRTQPARVLRGEAKVQAKLTVERVAEARRLHANGIKQAEIAREFGVDPSLISRVVRGVWWR